MGLDDKTINDDEDAVMELRMQKRKYCHALSRSHARFTEGADATFETAFSRPFFVLEEECDEIGSPLDQADKLPVVLKIEPAANKHAYLWSSHGLVRLTLARDARKALQSARSPDPSRRWNNSNTSP
jgi:hypothetical protein